MNKIASCFVGVGLGALVLSGCAAPSASAPRNTGSEASDVMGIGPELPLATAAGLGDSAAPSGDASASAAGTPGDASTPADEEFWQRNQAPLGTATAAIEEQFPDEFAYAFFDDSSAMHVAFTGSAPAEAVALLQSTGLPYVVVESVGFNAAEYQAVANDVSEQTSQYVTADRQVAVSPKPSIAPGVITVSFLSTDPDLTTDPGLTAPAGSRYKPVAVDLPFTVTFDDTQTSPFTMGTGTEKVGPSVEEQLALAPGER